MTCIGVFSSPSWMSSLKDFAALQLDAKDLTWLCASITMSCCMLGLGFASRDTSTSRVLGVPGKLKKDQEPLLVLAIVMLRSAEVICQVFAINFFHVSARWQGFALGGPILTMGLAMMAKCLLRKASVADVLAAVIAHPGQLLEPTSLFPLQSTMKIKMLSVTAVVASQAFARYASASEHAKACRARSAGLSWMWREVAKKKTQKPWHFGICSFTSGLL